MLHWLLEHTASNASDSGDWPARLAFMTEAALWLGDAATAERLHPRLSEYAGLNLMSGVFVAPFGPADCYLGEIESLTGTGAPLARFEQALDLAERTDAPLHAARTLAAMAAHLRRADPGSREAMEYAERARAIAEPTGMMRVLRSLDAGLAASALDSPGGLTAREREVIGLIAEGRSNRDIATRLVISEHTAANHVRNILTKIGAENRTQAAMYARERGLA
jgi:DNA-binding CsgD family transcriptional regulator